MSLAYISSASTNTLFFFKTSLWNENVDLLFQNLNKKEKSNFLFMNMIKLSKMNTLGSANYKTKESADKRKQIQIYTSSAVLHIIVIV